jgi:hypothetical protein
MSPTRKIMGEKIARSVRGNNLCVTLIEEGEGSSGRAGIDGLPQPVEDKDRLIELGIHDLVVAAWGVASSAFPFLSIVHV